MEELLSVRKALSVVGQMAAADAQQLSALSEAWSNTLIALECLT